jgi:hypothetical protein
MTPSTANGQLPGSEDKSPSKRSFQSAGSDSGDLKPEDQHISFIELPITISRAVSPDLNSLVDRKEFHFHVPLPSQVESRSKQLHSSRKVLKKNQDMELLSVESLVRKRDILKPCECANIQDGGQSTDGQ